jgi:ATP phosphoribosyltransferase regulatory subunit
MGTERWLLPEGIDEVLPPQAAQLERLRRDILDLFHAWGYDLVIPPFIEYLDSLLTGTGTDLDLQTFKLTDQLTGRLMGVRADMTPQVARIDAHRLRRDVPVRLCYLGTVLRTRPEGFSGSRSPLQVGAELYGHGGAESDVEVMRLMVEMLRLTRVTREIHIDLGHVGIFRGLAQHAGWNETQEAELFDALQRKARAEIQAALAAFPGAPAIKDMVAALIDLNGGAEVLPEARKTLRVAPRPVLDALDNLERIAQLLQQSTTGLPLYFDLAELRGYQYQTGVVFAAYVPGYGQEVARGGRYDDIGRVFGRARPATGFSADLKLLLSRTSDAAARGIFAPVSDDAELAATVARLRAEGQRVISALPGQQGDAAEMGCDRQLVQQNGQWVVR